MRSGKNEAGGFVPDPPPPKKESRKKVKRKEEVGDGQKLGQEITEVKKIYSGSTVRSFLLWPIA